MFSSILLNIVKTEFKGKKLISFEEIYSSAKKNEPKLTEKAVRWRLYYLRDKNLLASVFNNIYTVYVNNNFAPQIGNNVTKINSLLSKDYKATQFCFAESRWLNEFSVHQVFKSNTVCMVEEFMMESIFQFLTDKGFRVIYNPDEKDANLYLSNSESIIVTNLISRSPVFRYKNVRISKLEKLLVDAFFDSNIYSAFQGSELEQIFQNAESKCNINFSSMLNYSRRSGKYEKLREYLKKLFPQYDKYFSSIR